MTIESITLEVDDLEAAKRFYSAAFGLGPRLGLRATDPRTSGFRAFTLSLVVSQPATVDGFIWRRAGRRRGGDQAGGQVAVGLRRRRPSPDGAIWKVATSKKKNTGPATRQIDQIVLLLEAEDVPASKRFYIDRGLTVKRSFARSYAEFDASPASIQLVLYKRRALAKDAGVAPDGTGSHRLVIHSDVGPCTDPDGFAWKTAAVHDGQPTALATTASAISQTT